MISVSFLKSNQERNLTIKDINKSIANLIHVDIMDGIYVESKTANYQELIKSLKDTNKLLDIHLMVKDVKSYLKDLINLNVWAITFHIEALDNPKEIIDYLKMHNIKVGIAINPIYNAKILEDYIDMIDYVLVMGVNPGMGGQKCMLDVLDKINDIKKIRKDILIGFDGGVNDKTIKEIKKYPVDNIVSGSFVCMSNDYNKQINILKN